MSKQIDQLMSLARQWVEARTKGQGGSSQQDALRQALEAALKPGEPVAELGDCFLWCDTCKSVQESVHHTDQQDHDSWCNGEARWIQGPFYTAAPPVQTPLSEAVRFGTQEQRQRTLEQSVYAPPAQTPPKQEPRTGVWGYIDAQVARDMQGFYKAFGTATPPARIPMQMSVPDERGYATFTAPPPRLTGDDLWRFWWSRPEVPEGGDDSMEAEFVAAGRAIEAAVRRQFLGRDE